MCVQKDSVQAYFLLNVLFSNMLFLCRADGGQFCTANVRKKRNFAVLLIFAVEQTLTVCKRLINVNNVYEITIEGRVHLLSIFVHGNSRCIVYVFHPFGYLGHAFVVSFNGLRRSSCLTGGR